MSLVFSVFYFWKTSETVQVYSRCFYNLLKSSEIFGSVRNFLKFSENFGNGSKVTFRSFYDFLKFSENLRKSSETISGCDRKCS